MIQNRLRKPQQKRVSPVDGVLNAPVRSGENRAVASQRAMNGKDSFRSTTSRSVDSFRRQEGFHATNQSQGAARAQFGGMAGGSKPGQQSHQQPSILHMSLPGGSLSGGRRQVKNKRGGWRTFRRWTLRSAASVAVLVVLAGGFLFAKAFFSANQVFKGGGHAEALSCSAEEIEPAKLQQEGDGRVNVLMLGLDDEASLTDSILVASVDPANKTSATVSIPRDFWVTAPSGGSSKINAVYPNAERAALRNNPNDEAAAARAAVKELEAVVEEVLGLSIHFYITVDVAGFERAVDIVGGVTMDVPEELAVTEHMWDDVRNVPYLLDVSAGEQRFDPQRALFFVRTRKTSPRGDFDRAERQRLFLQALAQQVISSGTYTNPMRITRLMDTFSENVTTNLSVNDAWCLSKIAKDIDKSKMESVGLTDGPRPVVTTGMLSGQSIVQPVAGVGNYQSIHSFVRSKLVDGYIAREDARVMVLNGTTVPGKAASEADKLQSFGYNVTETGDAPTSDYQRTVLVRMNGNDKKYTQHYLQKRLSAQVTDNLPDGLFIQQEQNVDFVVILGGR